MYTGTQLIQKPLLLHYFLKILVFIDFLLQSKLDLRLCKKKMLFELKLHVCTVACSAGLVYSRISLGVLENFTAVICQPFKSHIHTPQTGNTHTYSYTECNVHTPHYSHSYSTTHTLSVLNCDLHDVLRLTLYIVSTVVPLKRTIKWYTCTSIWCVKTC